MIELELPFEASRERRKGGTLFRLSDPQIRGWKARLDARNAANVKSSIFSYPDRGRKASILEPFQGAGLTLRWTKDEFPLNGSPK